MNKIKTYIGGVVALACLVVVVKCLPWERQTSGITMWMMQQANEQVETSEVMTSAVVSSAEGSGKFAGKHEVNGSNWAIPNLLRHWFGVEE